MPRIPQLQKINRVGSGGPWTPFPKKLKVNPDFGRRGNEDKLKQLDLPFSEPAWKRSKKQVDEPFTSRKILNPSYIKQVTPMECYFFKDDIVEILVGPDTGKQGKVRVVVQEKNQLKVRNCHQVPEYTDNLRGDGTPGYLLIEAPLHFSEVKLVNPLNGLPSDVTWRYTEEGEKVRVCTSTSQIIPTPLEDDIPPDFKYKSRAVAPVGPSDTTEDCLKEYTYIPSLLLFHEEIMLEMNIPMTIKKEGLERRDLIMRELENDAELEAIEERVDSSDMVLQNPKSSMDRLKDFGNRLMFWK